MKIVVLAAGTSTEREVSIVSGTNVCKALRSKGHQAILVDVFFGKEGADSATAFDGDYDVDAEAAYISSFNDQVKDAVANENCRLLYHIFIHRNKLKSTLDCRFLYFSLFSQIIQKPLCSFFHIPVSFIEVSCIPGICYISSRSGKA